MFNLVLDWCTNAHKGRSQLDINADYATVIKAFRPGHGCSCRATTTQVSLSAFQSTLPSAGSGTADQSSAVEEEPQWRQLHLQKSCQVVTEWESWSGCGGVGCCCTSVTFKTHWMHLGSWLFHTHLGVCYWKWSEAAGDDHLDRAPFHYSAREVMMTGVFLEGMLARSSLLFWWWWWPSFSAKTVVSLHHMSMKPCLIQILINRNHFFCFINPTAIMTMALMTKLGEHTMLMGTLDTNWCALSHSGCSTYFNGTLRFFVVHPIIDAELQVTPSITIVDGTIQQYEPMAWVHSQRRSAIDTGSRCCTFPLDW